MFRRILLILAFALILVILSAATASANSTHTFNNDKWSGAVTNLDWSQMTLDPDFSLDFGHPVWTAPWPLDFIKMPALKFSLQMKVGLSGTFDITIRQANLNDAVDIDTRIRDGAQGIWAGGRTMYKERVDEGNIFDFIPVPYFLGLDMGCYIMGASTHPARLEGTFTNYYTIRLSGDADPKDHLIEVTVREQCFAPEKPFLNYIRVKGLICEHAATGAPVPQRGAISAHRGHHWIIEDCEVNWSNGAAIDTGHECWHHTHTPGEIVGWSVIRNCKIRDAGVCGIAGMFAERMLIEGNLIEGTGWQKMELSWEAGAIKLHNSVNGLIRNNVFRNTFRADHIWLDCGNENNRITGNIFLDGIEQREAIFIECTRDGINLIDHNIIWNVEGRFDPAKVPKEPGSSGWYKLRELDVVNGYGVYGEGTDRLHVSHNLISKCRHSGYYLKPVSFRMHGMMRGGTARDAKIINNIFYDCGEAAIDFPTKDNTAEGNLYVRMQGGYLRVMYPEPEYCLNLPAWQEFLGFDREGQNAWFDIDFNRETGETVFRTAKDKPSGFRGEAERLHMILDPKDVKTVAADMDLPYEQPERVLPGPFDELTIQDS